MGLTFVWLLLTQGGREAREKGGPGAEWVRHYGNPLRTKELRHLSQKPPTREPSQGARGPTGFRAGGLATAKGCLGIRGFCDR